MKIQLPDIPESEQTPLVKGLLSIIEQLMEQNRQQNEEIDILKDEVRLLKGQKKRPKFKPSKMEESTDVDKPDSAKREDKKNKPKNNKKDLTIHTE